MDQKLPPPPTTAAPIPIEQQGLTGPPKVTPGWNDPPEVPLNNANAPSGHKRILNKRVAFPLSSTPAGAPFPSPLNLPPIPIPSILNPDSINISDKHLQEVIDNITHQHGIGNSSITDLDEFSIKWKNDVNCTSQVKDLLLEASKYIKQGDTKQAESIYTTLSGIAGANWFSAFLHSVIVNNKF